MEKPKKESIPLDGLSINIFSFGDFPPSVILDKQPEILVCLGPGNPGCVELYLELAAEIHKRTGYPVWAHSLIGFDGEHIVDDDINLKRQVAVKKALIENYLSGLRLILVDHSTSCFITLQILQDPEFSPLIYQIFFLTPVLSSVNNIWGLALKAVVHSNLSEWGLDLFVKLSQIIPAQIHNLVLTFVLLPFNIHNTKRLTACYKQNVVRNGYYLGRELLAQRTDYKILMRFADRLHIASPNNDHLLDPNLKEFFENNPSLDVRLQNSKFCHFVFDESEKIGCIMADWIKEVVKKS